MPLSLPFEGLPPQRSTHYSSNNYYQQYLDDSLLLQTTKKHAYTANAYINSSQTQQTVQSQSRAISHTSPYGQHHQASADTIGSRSRHLPETQVVPNHLATIDSPHYLPVYGSDSTSDRLVATTLYSSHQMYASTPSMPGSTGVQQGKGLKRSRSHQRTPSTSTIASNGPNSPFTSAAPYTHIVNTDSSPHSPIPFIDQSFAKALPTPTQTPIEVSFAPSNTILHNAPLVMPDFALQQYHTDTDYPADMIPSRQSTSSHGNDSPATPHSGLDDNDARVSNTLQHDVKHNPHIPLFRSDSQQACQDELFSPYTAYASPSTSKNQTSTYLSPHRLRMTEALKHANQQRANSPAAAREPSPYKGDSIFATTQNWQNTMPSAGSAAQLRQRQKEQAEQAEYARTRPNLQREPTKTISPKDALLDHSDSVEHTPLFPVDSLPAGYETHRGGVEHWPNNDYMFGGSAPSSQPDVLFRTATPAESAYAQASLNFPSLPQSSADSIQGTSFPTNYASAMSAPKQENFESPPHFPAPLPSMETSNSDAGYGFSSQEDVNSKPQRPADTRANTGAYTCTYHNCHQRFDSQPNLQKHKRDTHRAQQTTPAPTESVSPRSTASPGPVGSGMTSAAILERNSQAGPHKCERINPSTGKPCNTIFSRPYDLTRHEDTIHNNRKQKVRCQYCREEKTFSRTDALTRHMRVVHPDIEASAKRGRRGD